MNRSETTPRPIDVSLTEVGPRDGLQSIAATMRTADKLAWIRAMADAGLREIEVASFVPPRLLPQMADAAEVVRQASGLKGLRVCALAPNLRGAKRAMEAGARRITLPLSVSVAHSLANLRCTPAAAIAAAREICAWRDGLPVAQRPLIEAGLATAFGCDLQGAVDADAVVRLASAALEAGCDSVSLGDTSAHANPAQVRRLVHRVRGAIGERLRALHLHDTRGLGLANVLAALDAGIHAFESSLAGLGGCPHAPTAGGNIVTEDLVFMLERMGLRTGVDLAKLLACREHLQRALPGIALRGSIAIAGTISDLNTTLESA